MKGLGSVLLAMPPLENRSQQAVLDLALGGGALDALGANKQDRGLATALAEDVIEGQGQARRGDVVLLLAEEALDRWRRGDAHARTTVDGVAEG